MNDKKISRLWPKLVGQADRRPVIIPHVNHHNYNFACLRMCADAYVYRIAVYAPSHIPFIGQRMKKKEEACKVLAF
jgi:hypothetical protein